MIVEANKKKFAYLKPDQAQKHYLDRLSQVELANQFRDDMVYYEDTKAFKKTHTKYYIVWCLLMDVVGEKPLPPECLVSEKPNSQTFQAVSRLPKITKSPQLIKQAKVKKLEDVAFPRVFKPEGGIYVMNTQHIQELSNKQLEDGSYVPSVNQIEHQVNLKLKQPERGAGFGIVTFTNQQYYDEAYRLSKHPELIRDSHMHPICKFIPSRSDDANDEGGNDSPARTTGDPRLGSQFSLVRLTDAAWLTAEHR